MITIDAEDRPEQDQSVNSPRLATNKGFRRHLAAHGDRSTVMLRAWSRAVWADLLGAPGRNRTCDTRFRKALLLGRSLCRLPAALHLTVIRFVKVIPQ